MKRNLHAGGMRSRGLSVNVFTESELDDIHLASLEVLERTGVFVEADDARDIFKDGGCTVDRETRMVRIPPHVVEDAIASSPSKYVLCGRDPKNDFLMEPGRVAFTNFSEGIAVVDIETGEAASRPCRTSPTSPASTTTSARWTPTRSPSAPGTSRPRRPRSTTPRRSCSTRPSPSASDRSRAWSAAPSSACARRSSAASRRAARAAHRVRRRLPGQPAQAAARCHRGDHRVLALGHPGQHPQHGDGRRLQPGHARRHARHAQRRGARRHHAGAAHRARLPGACTAARRRRWTSSSRRPPSARPRSR